MAKKRICSVEGCGKPHKALGYCVAHYKRFKRNGSTQKVKIRGTCSVDGCDQKHFGRGFCSKHWKRWKRHGDPLGGGPPYGTILKWIVEHVDHQGDECLIIPFGRAPNGYGRVQWNGKVELAHRVMCLLAHGEPPTPKHIVAHNCGMGDKGCCNPRHLRYATMVENKADQILHGTAPRGERNGHAKLTESDVRQIRSLNGKMLHREIAAMFGVSRIAVGDIINRRRWTWLDAEGDEDVSE